MLKPAKPAPPSPARSAHHAAPRAPAHCPPGARLLAHVAEQPVGTFLRPDGLPSNDGGQCGPWWRGGHDGGAAPPPDAAPVPHAPPLPPPALAALFARLSASRAPGVAIAAFCGGAGPHTLLSPLPV